MPTSRSPARDSATLIYRQSHPGAVGGVTSLAIAVDNLGPNGSVQRSCDTSGQTAAEDNSVAPAALIVFNAPWLSGVADACRAFEGFNLANRRRLRLTITTSRLPGGAVCRRGCDSLSSGQSRVHSG